MVILMLIGLVKYITTRLDMQNKSTCDDCENCLVVKPSVQHVLEWGLVSKLSHRFIIKKGKFTLDEIEL